MIAARTQWLAGRHLQQAADQLRDVGPDLHPVADWLDKTANQMAWHAPYRAHDGGHRPWQLATRIAHIALGLPDPDTCPTCHTHAGNDRKVQR